MTFDEETLMAYADGELDGVQRAQIAAALEQDPALAARVESHRAMRARVAGAFAPVLEQPVPDALRAVANPPAATTAPPRVRGNVVQFPTRGTRAGVATWRAREWLAMAASLMLGVFVAWRVFAPAGSVAFEAREGALVARGALATALDAQLASAQPRDAAVTIGLTFKARDGGYCRSFALRDAGVSGLACRASGEWRIPVTASADAAGGDFRQAAGAIPPAVLQAIEARIAGEPLASAAESAARDGGWRKAP